MEELFSVVQLNLDISLSFAIHFTYVSPTSHPSRSYGQSCGFYPPEVVNFRRGCPHFRHILITTSPLYFARSSLCFVFSQSVYNHYYHLRCCLPSCCLNSNTTRIHRIESPMVSLEAARKPSLNSLNPAVAPVYPSSSLSPCTVTPVCG